MGSVQYGEEKSETSSLYVLMSVHSIVDYIEGGGVYEMKFECCSHDSHIWSNMSSTRTHVPANSSSPLVSHISYSSSVL